MEKKNKNLVIAIITLVLILAIILIIANIKKDDNKAISEKEITFGNEIYNLTSYNNNIIKYKNWIIYSGGVNLANGLFGKKIEGIYKYNIDNGQIICLSNYNGSNFNIIDDTLYYINEFGEINTINVDTNDQKKRITWINSSEYEASNLLIYDNSIFYTDNNGYNIYKTDFNGSKRTLVAEYTTGSFQIYNNFIYYRESQTCKLYRKDLTNDSQCENILDDAINEFYVEDEKIYYITGDSLRVYDISSKFNNVIIKNITSNFVINDSCIYFYSSNDKSLKQYNIENGEEKNLIDNFEKDIYRIQMYNNIIFYSITANSSSAQILYYDIDEGKTNAINLKDN